MCYGAISFLSIISKIHIYISQCVSVLHAPMSEQETECGGKPVNCEWQQSRKDEIHCIAIVLILTFLLSY